MRSKVRSLDEYERFISKQNEPSEPAGTTEAAASDKAAAAKNGVEAAVPPLAAVLPQKEKKAAGGAAGKKTVAPSQTSPNTPPRYVLRGGVTVTVTDAPASDISALPSPRKPEPKSVTGLDAAETAIIKAVPSSDVVSAASEKGEAAASPASLWERLPRHIQLLAQIPAPLEEEVAQKYYTRGFRESREELIERLLDPPLTLEDTARVLGVCPATVRRYTNRGVLLHQRTVGQQRRFRLSDVLLFLEQQQIKSAKSKK